MSTFQLVGIEPKQFEPLFELSDAELAGQGIVRRTADKRPGFPCRVSLDDAPIGAELLLLHYFHHAVGSPYRASGPIYVGRGQAKRTLAPGVVPDYVTSRVISLRAYHASHMMVAAEVSEGTAVAERLAQLFANCAVAYVHLHNAKQGCFSCSASRV